MFILRNIPKYQVLLEQASRYPELDIATVETCLTFLRTTASVLEAYDAHFDRYGLSMGKFSVLMLLEQTCRQGLTPSECAERAGVTRGTITGLLDGLERDGLVKREPHPADRRRMVIQLTQKGQQLLTSMLPDHFCRTSALFGSLTAAERQTLVKLLSKLQAKTPVVANP
ncbi:MAG: MarR family transcriptional regulator [Chroococcidiopsidaceae cyanobacterium CP_BM_RX_35]|nr:MarR family transcriptional regulator [Chroococcidiopsidaceae cyanobacterium CP_BM_RX_35]